MAITLEKGQRIEIGLTKVSVGLGWDPNESTGFVAIIFIGQIVIVEGLYDFFNCTPMKLMDWVIIIVLSSTVLWIRELWHCITKRY